MAKENEIMILDVNRGEAIARLKTLNARHLGASRYRRIEFLLKGKVRGTRHSWGRVRTDGRKTTLTVKALMGGGTKVPMEEYEVETANFEDTAMVIGKLINSPLMLYFENERDAYILGKTHITIDKWPEIPCFIEIEAPSMKAAREMHRRLGISGKLVGNAPIHSVYKRYGLDFKSVMAKNDGKLKRLTKR